MTFTGKRATRKQQNCFEVVRYSDSTLTGLVGWVMAGDENPGPGKCYMLLISPTAGALNDIILDTTGDGMPVENCRTEDIDSSGGPLAARASAAPGGPDPPGGMCGPRSDFPDGTGACGRGA